MFPFLLIGLAAAAIVLSARKLAASETPGTGTGAPSAQGDGAGAGATPSASWASASLASDAAGDSLLAQILTGGSGAPRPGGVDASWSRTDPATGALLLSNVGRGNLNLLLASYVAVPEWTYPDGTTGFSHKVYSNQVLRDLSRDSGSVFVRKLQNAGATIILYKPDLDRLEKGERPESINFYSTKDVGAWTAAHSADYVYWV